MVIGSCQNFSYSAPSRSLMEVTLEEQVFMIDIKPTFIFRKFTAVSISFHYPPVLPFCLNLLSAQIEKTFQVWRAVNCTTLHGLFLVLFCCLEKSLNLLKGWKEGQVSKNSSEPAGSCPPFVSVPHFCKYLQKGKSGLVRKTTTHWTKHRGSFSSTACSNNLIYQILLTFYNTLSAMVKNN